MVPWGHPDNRSREPERKITLAAEAYANMGIEIYGAAWETTMVPVEVGLTVYCPRRAQSRDDVPKTSAPKS
jgi:hypothetical protein